MSEHISPEMYKERNELIYEGHQKGFTFMELGWMFDITGCRAQQIYVQTKAKRELEAKRRSWQELDQEREQRWRHRPTICGGHPEFDDPYGVDQVWTLEEQYLEDERELIAQNLGATK